MNAELKTVRSALKIKLKKVALIRINTRLNMTMRTAREAKVQVIFMLPRFCLKQNQFLLATGWSTLISSTLASSQKRKNKRYSYQETGLPHEFFSSRHVTLIQSVRDWEIMQQREITRQTFIENLERCSQLTIPFFPRAINF